MMDDSIDSFKSKHTEKGHIALHVLVMLFGVSSWIGINGIFVQLPVLINVSPEGWNLPVYAVLVIQCANVGPLIYTVLQKLRYELNRSFCILCLLVSETLAMILLIFFYSERTVIGGVEHSLALYTLIFFIALVGCFSSLLFMPYLHDFNKIYLVSYFIGEGLSGVLPSIIALIQGIGDNSQCKTTDANGTVDSSISDLKFSPGDYFVFLSTILLLSLSSFILLEYSPFVRDRKNLNSNDEIAEETEINHNFQTKSKATSSALYIDSTESAEHSLRGGDGVMRRVLTQQTTRHLSNKTRMYLLLLLGISCFCGHGFLPSIQTYSCLPYGNIAYKLSIVLSQIANPLACFLRFWLTASSTKIVNSLFIVSLAIGSYVTYLALKSPVPPWQGLKLGITIVVLSWTILIGLISYLKLTIVSTFRNTASPQTLFNVGAVMQVGSAVGAVVSFLMINYTNTFTMYDGCVSGSD